MTSPGTRPAPELLGEAADTFALLAAPVRVHLLQLLARGEEDVSTRAEHVGSTVPNVSQHLAELRLAGLVIAPRRGRQVYLADDPHVVALVTQALDHHGELLGRTDLPRRTTKAG